MAGGGPSYGFFTGSGPGSLAGSQAAAGTASPWFSMASVNDFGTALSFAGIGMQAIGAFYDMQANKDQLKARAEQNRHEGSLAAISARNAELEAQAILEQGEVAVGLRTLQTGQEKGAAIARQGASGITAGVGSGGDELAAIQFASDVDVYNLGINKVRAAGAARAGRVNSENRARAAAVSANNARRSAASLSPALAGGISLIGNAGNMARRSARGRSIWAGSEDYGDN